MLISGAVLQLKVTVVFDHGLEFAWICYCIRSLKPLPHNPTMVVLRVHQEILNFASISSTSQIKTNCTVWDSLRLPARFVPIRNHHCSLVALYTCWLGTVCRGILHCIGLGEAPNSLDQTYQWKASDILGEKILDGFLASLIKSRSSSISQAAFWEVSCEGWISEAPMLGQSHLWWSPA